MIKKTFFLLALIWITTGCAPQMAEGPQACAPYTETAASCTGDKNDPKVTINVDTMTVDPECVRAKKDKQIHIKLDGQSIKKNTVTIFPKDPADDWLTGVNKARRNIVIKVPKNKKDGTDLPAVIYSYGIKTPTGCIDPRVSVEN